MLTKMKPSSLLKAISVPVGVLSLALVSVGHSAAEPGLPVAIKLDANRPRPLFFMTAAELQRFKADLVEGRSEATARLKSLRGYADREMAGDRSFARPGRRCKYVALVGLWTSERKYLDHAAQMLMEQAKTGPGTANEAHRDHYHNNFYSFLEAYDYLLAADALTREQKRLIEEGYFRKSMTRTREHWASKACDNHGVVEDEAAVLAGACLQDEALLRFGLERTFHHLAHDVLDDGCWYQESMLVHDMNVARFRRIIKACLNSGIDLRRVAVPPVAHQPYLEGERRPRTFSMMAEPMVQLATSDLKIPCSGYYTSVYPYIRARPDVLSEMLSWRGKPVLPKDVVTRIQTQKSTLLPSLGFAALRSGAGNERMCAFMHYGPTDHHAGSMNFLIWADGRFLTADFSRIDGWATPMYRAYTERTWSHNCVVVDERSHSHAGGIHATPGGELVYFGQAEGLSVVHARSAELSEGVEWDRVLALTDQYLVVVDHLRSDEPRTYDWMFHFACGPEFVATGLRQLAEPSPIAYPYFDNVKAHAPADDIAFVGNCDGVRLAVRVLGRKEDVVAFAECPARIKQEPSTLLVERVGKVVVRRPGTDVTFFSVFEPIREAQLISRITSPGSERLTLHCSDGRVDRMDLRSGYVWTSIADGRPAREVRLAGESWTDLFDGKSLAGWKVTELGGHGDVRVNDGTIVLDFGAASLTGITWAGPVRRMDYEVSLEAMRVDGHDFFCGLTFPVKQSSCSLIVGGWGGSLVGISSFDDLDASENETTRDVTFENGRWYRIRLRVTQHRIEAWIDEEKVVDAWPGTRRISVRPEVELSQPLGVAAWNTKAALRKIRVRTVRPE